MMAFSICFFYSIILSRTCLNKVCPYRQDIQMQGIYTYIHHVGTAFADF